MKDYKYVNYKDIEKRVGIRFRNPKFRRRIKRSIRERIMIFISSFYRKHRTVLSKIWKENDSLKCFLDLERQYSTDEYNSASKQFNSDTNMREEPYFNLERIHFAEILPKGEVEKFENDFESFINRNRKESLISFDNDDNLNILELICQSRFKHLLAAFAINEKTQLGKVFDYCRISAESMSDSFIRIVFDFGLNDQYQKVISDVCVGNVEKYKTYSSIKKIKFKNWRFLSEGYYSEYLYKKCIVDALIDEVKYCARHEVIKSMDFLNYPGESNGYKAFLFWDTNISKNSDIKFWQSIGIDIDRCYFSDMADACVTYLMNDSCDIACICKENKKYRYVDIFRAEAANCFNNILAYSHAQQNCVDSLTRINRWMRKCKNDPLSVWMTLYTKADSALELLRKFYDEYTFGDGKVAEMLHFENGEGELIAFESYEVTIDREIDINLRHIKTTQRIITEKMNAKNTIVSMEIQKLSVVIGMVSAVISFVAILFTLMGNEANQSFLNANKEVIFNVFAFVIAAVIAYYIVSLVRASIDTILKVIRFR